MAEYGVVIPLGKNAVSRALPAINARILWALLARDVEYRLAA